MSRLFNRESPKRKGSMSGFFRFGQGGMVPEEAQASKLFPGMCDQAALGIGWDDIFMTGCGKVGFNGVQPVPERPKISGKPHVSRPIKKGFSSGSDSWCLTLPMLEHEISHEWE